MSHLKQYTGYLRNAGGSVTLAQFDDDWEPIGPMVRADLRKYKMAEEKDGRIYPKDQSQ